MDWAERIMREAIGNATGDADAVSRAAAALRAEREACARLADEFRDLPHGAVPSRGLEATWAAATQIADAIRNRTE